MSFMKQKNISYQVNHCQNDLVDNRHLTRFVTRGKSFVNANNLIIESYPTILFYILDLPNLEYIELGKESFRFASSATIKSSVIYKLYCFRPS